MTQSGVRQRRRLPDRSLRLRVRADAARSPLARARFVESVARAPAAGGDPLLWGAARGVAAAARGSGQRKASAVLGRGGPGRGTMGAAIHA